MGATTDLLLWPLKDGLNLLGIVRRKKIRIIYYVAAQKSIQAFTQDFRQLKFSIKSISINEIEKELDLDHLWELKNSKLMTQLPPLRYYFSSLPQTRKIQSS